MTVAAGVPWGAAAFALGATFCIALGALMLDGDTLPRWLPAAESLGSGCTTLSIDRHSGDTVAEPCRSPVPQTEAVASVRSDLTTP